MERITSNENPLPDFGEVVNEVIVSLEHKGYDISVTAGALVVSKVTGEIPVEEIETIVSFIREIPDVHLSGMCMARTAETVFSGLAQYAWSRAPLTDNTGVLPPGYHTLSGKTLANGTCVAFDVVTRAITFSSHGKHEPLAETVIFHTESEKEIKEALSTFYGGTFIKQPIDDDPYMRHIAKRT